MRNGFFMPGRDDAKGHAYEDLEINGVTYRMTTGTFSEGMKQIYICLGGPLHGLVKEMPWCSFFELVALDKNAVLDPNNPQKIPAMRYIAKPGPGYWFFVHVDLIRKDFWEFYKQCCRENPDFGKKSQPGIGDALFPALDGEIPGGGDALHGSPPPFLLPDSDVRNNID